MFPDSEPGIGRAGTHRRRIIATGRGGPVFDRVLGIPAHPLFIHAAVVLVPLLVLTHFGAKMVWSGF